MVKARITKHPVLEVLESKLVRFTFDGKEYQGRDGEMVSSALFANGIKSFSIHRVGDAPQGIFCANGQCSQCTVVIDGHPLKSCVTPLAEGMEVKTLKHFPEVPYDETQVSGVSPEEKECDVLIVGAGPAGIRAAIELSEQGFSSILVDDKTELGGKLVLQTHKFFGSMADCFAGTRGNDIGILLDKELEAHKKITVMRNSTVAALYSDGKAGVLEDAKRYTHIAFRALLVSTGARERSLIFPGNDLPGVFGAGAFQTLVNRDQVQASDRVLVVGCGNVGLIGAYHALQAGISVVGLLDIAPKISGYKVHADKIKRMGVPIYLNHTLLGVEGEGKVERATIAEVDSDYKPLLETAKTFEVDTVLIAVGLASSDEFLHTAREFQFPVLTAGDADEIAEASSAMMGGKIIGRKMAGLLGKDIAVPEEWYEKAEILKSHPGDVIKREQPSLKQGAFQPVFHCTEEIPCNPCTTVCPKGSITLEEKTGTILDLPQFHGDCIGCGLCVLICPGLATTLVRLKKEDPTKAEVVLPHEFNHSYAVQDFITLTDVDGEDLGVGTVIKTTYSKKHKTHLITVEVPEDLGTKVVGIRVQGEEITRPLLEASTSFLPHEGILCRCERITVGETLDFIRENHVTDINQLKLLRVGMGACGGKTCSVLLPRVLGQAGVTRDKIVPGTRRPLEVEIPMGVIANME